MMKKRRRKNPEEYDSKILDRNCWWLTNTASADDDDWNALDSCSWARCACLAQIESKDSQGLWSCLWGVPDVPAQGNVKSGLFAEVMPSLYVSNSSIKQRRTFQKLFFFSSSVLAAFLCTTEQLRFVSKESLKATLITSHMFYDTMFSQETY